MTGKWAQRRPALQWVILERLSYSNCIFKIFSSAGVNLCADGSSCFVGLVVTVAGGGGVLHCDNEEEIDR